MTIGLRPNEVGRISGFEAEGHIVSKEDEVKLAAASPPIPPQLIHGGLGGCTLFSISICINEALNYLDLNYLDLAQQIEYWNSWVDWIDSEALLKLDGLFHYSQD